MNANFEVAVIIKGNGLGAFHIALFPQLRVNSWATCLERRRENLN